MNKKLLIFTLLFLLFSASFASARICDTQNVLNVLRKALYIYYKEPSASIFTADELKDLLSFYIGIQTGQVTIDCTEQSEKIDMANDLPDNIPSCSDGTKYGKCSSTKPMYCYAGRLVPRCRLCGCPSDQWCDITYVYTEKGNKGQWGKCNLGLNITCTVDSDCGTSGYIGNYYCKELDVYKNYIKYTCLNPGETNSNCKTETLIVLADDCQTGEQCVEGQAECQIILQNQTCSDGTQYGQCSTTKPKYCDNGALTNKCSNCGCNTGENCKTDENCKTPTCTESKPTTNMLSSNFNIFNANACLDGILGPSEGTYCLHDSPTDGYLKIDLGTGNEQEYTKTRFYGSSQPSPATQFQIQYSDDGTNWNTVGTITMPISETSTWHELSWTSVGAHRYWRYKYLTGWRSPVLHEIEWYTPNCQPQTCSDGTQYGQCSTTKPKYCDNGALTNKCSNCGCNTGENCKTDENCEASTEGKAYRKARWSWQATFDYLVNIQYSNDKVNWYDATPCSHVRFREPMDQQAQTWDNVGAHKYWALHVCGTAGTPPFQIWEMDWFTHDGTNYIEENPTADKISFEGSYTSFDASKLVDNNLDTSGLQKNDKNEARLIIG